MDSFKASYIWHCICCHDGFAEDSGEWLQNNGISEDEMNSFSELVLGAIDSLDDKDE